MLLPIETDAWLEARVEKVEERKVWTRCESCDDSGEPFAEASSLYLRLDLERFRDILERAAAEYGVRPEEFFKLAT